MQFLWNVLAIHIRTDSNKTDQVFKITCIMTMPEPSVSIMIVALSILRGKLTTTISIKKKG